jgi:hypothetical protein
MKLFGENQQILCVCREHDSNEIYITREKPEIITDADGKDKTDMLLSECTVRSEGRINIPKSALKTLGVKKKEQVALEALRFIHKESKTEDYKVYVRLLK